MYQTKSYFNVTPGIFGELIEDIFQNGWKGGSEKANGYNPPVNIKETENSFEVELVAPGLKKEDFKINVEKNLLTISYEKKEEAAETAGKILRTEFKQRSFKRTFTLNDRINTAEISAKYTDGILSITLNKKPEAQPNVHEIAVN
jgi:HSP20 family protein